MGQADEAFREGEDEEAEASMTPDSSLRAVLGDPVDVLVGQQMYTINLLLHTC